MTVCIAAITLVPSGDPKIVFCLDMKAATDLGSAETSYKLIRLPTRFWVLMAGPLSEAREIGATIGEALKIRTPSTLPEMIQDLRDALGIHRKAMADAHTKATLGIAYEEFRKKGKSAWPEDLHRRVSWDIHNHPASVELIVLGFFPNGNPALVKISANRVWACDTFAVIGSGTPIAESALFQRSLDIHDAPENTIYHVYEAKRLAENEPNVGKRTIMMVLKRGKPGELVTETGFKFLARQFAKFGPQRFKASALPVDMFEALKTL